MGPGFPPTCHLGVFDLLWSKFNHRLPSSNAVRVPLSLTPNDWAPGLSSHHCRMEDVREQGGSPEVTSGQKKGRSLCEEKQWSCGDSIDPARCSGLTGTSVLCSVHSFVQLVWHEGLLPCLPCCKWEGCFWSCSKSSYLISAQDIWEELIILSLSPFRPLSLSVSSDVILSLTVSLQLESMLFIVLMQTSVPTLPGSRAALLNCWNEPVLMLLHSRVKEHPHPSEDYTQLMWQRPYHCIPMLISNKVTWTTIINMSPQGLSLPKLPSPFFLCLCI